MTIQVNREKLLHTLQSLQAGLTPDATIDQSNCFIFAGGEVLTFNGEVCCRAPSPLGDYEGAVKAKKILEALNKVSVGEITVEPKDDKLLFRWEKERTHLFTESDILSRAGAVPRPDKWKKLHPEFTEAISVVAECANPNAGYYELTLVHLTPERIEAYDQKQACQWEMVTGLTDSVLIKQRVLKSILSLNPADFAETDGWLHFRTEDGVIASCRVAEMERDYRDLSPAFRFDGELVRLPKELTGLLDRAATFSKENGESDDVRVTIRTGEISVESEGISGGHFGSLGLDYAGGTEVFNVSASLFAKLVKKHDDFELGKGRLRIEGEKYIYVAALNKVEGTPAPAEEPPSPIKNLTRKKNKKREEEEGEEE